jgi:hypothetical protein
LHYKGSTKTTPEIARELNVDAVLEGSFAGESKHSSGIHQLTVKSYSATNTIVLR